ncbi:MAG: FMN-binding protein [Sedimentisphaerales bacterium]|nr:FMN-binding protein [Sedimentisphaerales bacterium]
MKEKSLFPVGYMFVVTAVFSSVLIGLNAFTRDKVEANQQIAFERAVLEVFDLAHGGPQKIHQTFVERILTPTPDNPNQTYLLKEGDTTAGIALPFEGQGFWAPIRGILGFKPDGKTITGIAFYEQSETPGLGAEIIKSYFRDQFKGKIVTETDQPLRLRSVGSNLDNNEVHAITGATQTCTRLERILNDAITEWKSDSTGKGGTP